MNIKKLRKKERRIERKLEKVRRKIMKAEPPTMVLSKMPPISDLIREMYKRTGLWGGVDSGGQGRLNQSEEFPDVIGGDDN